jgi:diguanylate cyclase (GGDEF)-like protein
MPKALFHPADSEIALPQFVVIEGPQVGRTYEVSDGDKIGTHSESIILLPERRSQELQAQIAQIHGLFHIRNLSSTIPLLVNGEILEESPLHHGDMVVMGDLMLLFNEDHDPSRNQLQDFISSVELEENSISSRRKSFENSNSLLNTFVGLDREADRLKTLTRISHVINSIVKLDDLLEQILNVLFELLPADRGYIYLREEESRRLRPMATRSRDGLSSRSTGQISRTLIREVQRTRESVLTEDAMDDERFLSGESIVDQQIRSALCVPLLHDQEFVGVICLDTAYASQAFSEADHKLLNMVAYQAAGAILNVQLYEHRRQHVQNIHKVATAITRIARHLSTRNILQEAVQQLHIVFGVDRCSIMTSSDHSGETTLRIEHAMGLDRKLIRRQQTPSDEGLAGWVFQNNRPLRLSGQTAPSDSESPEFSPPPPLSQRPQYKTDSCLLVPICIQGEKPHGVVNLTDKRDGRTFTANDQEVLMILANQVGIALHNAELYERATVDSLTQVYLRRHFFQRLQELIRKGPQSKDPLILIMLDIDHFKQINDTYGHPAGDQVLRELGQLLRQNLRDEDIPARYGGEEFAILLRGTTYTVGQQVAERIRSSAERFSFNAKQTPIQLTVSIGIGQRNPDENAEALLSKVDQALYRAKRGGRNRIEQAISSPPIPDAPEA